MSISHINGIRRDELLHEVIAANGDSGHAKDGASNWLKFRLDRPELELSCWRRIVKVMGLSQGSQQADYIEVHCECSWGLVLMLSNHSFKGSQIHYCLRCAILYTQSTFKSIVLINSYCARCFFLRRRQICAALHHDPSKPC